MAEYGLTDEATYIQIKEGVDKELQKQKDEYGSMGSSKILGKDTLVQFLKDYRNQLQELVNAIGQ